MMANIAMQAVLPASDIERARRWYSEKLGLEPISTNPFDAHDRRLPRA